MSTNTSRTRPLRTGELAGLAGVSKDTLRYYERRQLLPKAPRSASGYRLFPPEAFDRVRLIRGALSIGFSVAELAVIFSERDRGGAPCRLVRRLASNKLAALEERLRDLGRLRRDLKATLSQWDRSLRQTPRGQRAGLLEVFARTHPTRQARTALRIALAGDNHRQESKQ